jgi:uncharacterized protein YceK
MKAAFIALLLTLGMAGCARASSPIILDLATRDAQTHYYINGQKKSADEAEAWCRSAAGFGGELLVYVRTDDQTPFTAVFDVLQRLKRARVAKFHLVTTDASGTQISLRSATESIQPEPQNLPRQIPK